MVGCLKRTMPRCMSFNNISLSIHHKARHQMSCPSFFLRNSNSKLCLSQPRLFKNFRRSQTKAAQVFLKKTLMLNLTILRLIIFRTMVMTMMSSFFPSEDQDKPVSSPCEVIKSRFLLSLLPLMDSPLIALSHFSTEHKFFSCM